ncbi:hypothetical protein [Sphingomonas hankookensis]|uniref:hypothetical protein n=1 Tax=Sphingomonas hankookensis TaxID=563996 RepID=UPI003F7947AF
MSNRIVRPSGESDGAIHVPSRASKASVRSMAGAGTACRAPAGIAPASIAARIVEWRKR